MQVGAEIRRGRKLHRRALRSADASLAGRKRALELPHRGELPAFNRPGNQPSGNHDFDGQARPQGGRVDWGADEVPTTTTQGLVTYSSGDFGTVLVGATATRTITATVSGAPITFISSTSPAAPFAKTADNCAGTTVPVGGNCTFTVTYTPTSGTTSNGSFTVTDDASGSRRRSP